MTRILSFCFAVLLAALANPPAATAQTDDPTRQYWMGDIETGSPANPLLPFMATLWKEGEVWRGAIDIPPAPGIGGAWWMELLAVDITPDRIELVQPPQRAGAAANTFAMVRATSGADIASGKLLIAGSTPINARMWRVTEAEAKDFMPRRPQNPIGPQPYQQTRVRVPIERDGDTVEVDGVLTLPAGPGPHPTVLMVNSLDVHDADHSSMGHKPYLVLADRLARAGIASLRTADPPLRMPGMAPQVQLTTETLGHEAAARISWLAAQKGVDGNRIALLGMNEGAIAAAIAAKLAGDRVDALVLLAPQAISGLEQFRAEFAEAVRREGETAAFVESRTVSFIKPYQLLARGAPRQEVVEAINAEMTMQRAARRQQLGEASAEVIRGLADQQYLIINTPEFQHNLVFDPADTLRALKQPTLAILGDRDARCPLSVNRAAIDGSLGKREGVESLVIIGKGLNHRLQPAVSGSIEEVQDLEMTFDESVLTECISFLRRQFGMPELATKEER